LICNTKKNRIHAKDSGVIPRNGPGKVVLILKGTAKGGTILSKEEDWGSGEPEKKSRRRRGWDQALLIRSREIARVYPREYRRESP